MKKKLPILLIIAGILFFAVKNSFFKNDHRKNNLKYTSAIEIPANVERNSIQNIDTTKIIENLCERPVTSNVSASNGLVIRNFVPCNWEENFATEKQGAVTSYSKRDINGLIQMVLLVKELPNLVSSQQKKDFFSLENIKKSAAQVDAISYRKGSLAGLDCQEFIFKTNNLSEAPGVTSYAIHFETIFKNKYITLTYGVAHTDSSQASEVFYQYLPIFKTLSQKFKISN